MTDVGYKLTLDGVAVKRELDEIHRRAVTLGGGLGAIDKASKQAVKGMSAFGPMLGGLSRSSSEALRGIGDLASFIGGGFTAAVVGVGVMSVVKLHDELTKLERQGAATFRIMREASNREIDVIEKRIDGLQAKIASFGRTGARLNYDTAADARRKAIEEEADALGKLAGLPAAREETLALKRRAETGGVGGSFDNTEVALRNDQLKQISAMQQREEERLRSARERLGLLSQELESAKKLIALEDQAAANAEGQAKAEKAKADAKAARAKVGNELGTNATIGNVMKERAKVLQKEREAEAEIMWQAGMDEAKALAKLEEDAAKRSREQAQKNADDMVRIAEDREKRKLDAVKAAADEEARIISARAADISSVLITSANMTAGLIASDAANRKQVAAELLSAEAARAGGAIQMKGAELIGTGAALALGSGGAASPLAAAQIAGGVALIGAGAALAVGGPAAIPQILGVAGVGGSGAVGGDRGVNTSAPRRRGGGSGEQRGGEVVYNINYGVAGPTAEDQARELSRRNGLAERRRFT